MVPAAAVNAAWAIESLRRNPFVIHSLLPLRQLRETPPWSRELDLGLRDRPGAVASHIPHSLDVKASARPLRS